MWHANTIRKANRITLLLRVVSKSILAKTDVERFEPKVKSASKPRLMYRRKERESPN